jgi:hypothetical protein
MADPDKKMDEAQLCTSVSALVRDAEAYRTERSADRVKAMDYFDGNMDQYVPADDGRSKVVSRDVRSAVKKVLPSLIRTILGNDEIVEYTPVGEGDEGSADQATDYVNYIALPECDGRQVIEDAINDALRLRNGIIKWWQETKIDVKVSVHTGLDEMSFVELAADDSVDVIEHTERTEQVDTPEGQVEEVVHDLKIRRRIETSTSRIGSIPLENWLIHPDAIRLVDSPILGENCKLRRTDLVQMGYDRKKIDKLPIASTGATEQEDEEDTRRRDVFNTDDALTNALQEIEYYDLLVRIDYDNDGIAELRRLVFAGGLKQENLLENTEWDEINYADIVSERRPHQWEGNSIPDDTMEIQKIKTVLLRQTMDNLYWQNNLQPIVQEGQISNLEAVYTPKFGQPILVSQGTDVRSAVGYNIVPMVADKSFNMLEYLDGELTDRTGVSDASSGLAPDALQNMTAKASAMVEQSGIGQTEMMVRCVATSLRPVFKGLLKLIIQHQDKPRTVRLRDKWVTFDPRSWNADMDAMVNTGLGAGTRERDMMAMQQVIGLQEKLLLSLGPDNPYVKPDNVYNAIAKLVESAGLRSVGLYFTQPDPEEVKQKLDAAQNQPNPEEIKAKAAIELENVRTQGKIAVEQFKGQTKQAEFAAKLEVEASKEREQRDADLTTQQAQLDADSENLRQELIAKAALSQQDNDAALDRDLIKQQTEREWMMTQGLIAETRMESDVQKAHAATVGKALDRQPDGNTQGRNGK